MVRLEARSRRVVVGPRPALARTRILLREVNWLGGPESELRIAARVRSTRPPCPATLSRLAGDRALVVLDASEEGVAPGQACVFTLGERVLGGGWIDAADEGL